MPELRTVTQVVDALGSNRGVSKLTGVSSMAVSNWKRFRKFPPRFYVLMQGELNKLGFQAPARLWDFAERKKS